MTVCKLTGNLAFSVENAKKQLYATCPASNSAQTTISDQLVNIAEHLTAKESDIGQSELKGRENWTYSTPIRWTET